MVGEGVGDGVRTGGGAEDERLLDVGMSRMLAGTSLWSMRCPVCGHTPRLPNPLPYFELVGIYKKKKTQTQQDDGTCNF